MIFLILFYLNKKILTIFLETILDFLKNFFDFLKTFWKLFGTFLRTYFKHF